MLLSFATAPKLPGVESSGQPNIVPTAQTSEASDYGGYLAKIDKFIPLKFNLQLYDLIREAIPILDVIPIKFNRLIGNFSIDTYGNVSLKQLMEDFYKNVQVNWFNRGINSFQYQLFDSAIVKGMGFGETVLTKEWDGIHRLKIARANDFRFMVVDDRMQLGYKKTGNFYPIAFENSSFIHYLALDCREGHPQGYSMFYSLPFIAQSLLRMQQSIDNHIWRLGDPTFYVAIESDIATPDYEAVKAVAVDTRAQVIAVNQARRQGKCGDLHCAPPPGSKVRFGILGENVTLPSLEFEMRTCLEQAITRTSFPPFVFGLYKWTSNEKMSKEQNDMIVSEIWSMRTQIEPIMQNIFDTFLITEGKGGEKWKMIWEDVNLMDEAEKARARMLNAAALEKELKALEFLLNQGLMDDPDEIADYLRRCGINLKSAKMSMSDIMTLARKKLLASKLAQKLSENRRNGDGNVLAAVRF